VLNLFHIDLVHFGIVLLVNLTLGQVTPPVGVLLFVASSFTKIRFGEIVREVWPFIGILVVVLGILTYVPWVSLALPSMFKG
jgi:C4-dicarboxylate transporter DctM subunit